MARPSPSVFRSIAALSRKAASRAPNLKGTSTAAPAASFEVPAALRPPSSRILRFRGAIVSLQPLHAASAQALFVSRLSFGSQDPVFLMQDGEDGT